MQPHKDCTMLGLQQHPHQIPRIVLLLVIVSILVLSVTLLSRPWDARRRISFDSRRLMSSVQHLGSGKEDHSQWSGKHLKLKASSAPSDLRPLQKISATKLHSQQIMDHSLVFVAKVLSPLHASAPLYSSVTSLPRVPSTAAKVAAGIGYDLDIILMRPA